MSLGNQPLAPDDDLALVQCHLRDAYAELAKLVQFDIRAGLACDLIEYVDGVVFACHPLDRPPVYGGLRVWERALAWARHQRIEARNTPIDSPGVAWDDVESVRVTEFHGGDFDHFLYSNDLPTELYGWSWPDIDEPSDALQLTRLQRGMGRERP